MVNVVPMFCQKCHRETLFLQGAMFGWEHHMYPETFHVMNPKTSWIDKSITTLDQGGIFIELKSGQTGPRSLWGDGDGPGI